MFGVGTGHVKEDFDPVVFLFHALDARADEALKQGNLALYAEEHKRARAVLDKLEKMLEKIRK
jgi:hemerythrin-like domain-containing protein